MTGESVQKCTYFYATVQSQDCGWDWKDPQLQCHSHSTASQTWTTVLNVEYRRHAHWTEILLCKTAAGQATDLQRSLCSCIVLTIVLAIKTHTHTSSQCNKPINSCVEICNIATFVNMPYSNLELDLLFSEITYKKAYEMCNMHKLAESEVKLKCDNVMAEQQVKF